MLYVLKVNQAQPESGWTALYRSDKEPYYFCSVVDFWLSCTVVDTADLEQEYPLMRNRLLRGMPLLEDDKDILKAKSYDGVFAAEVGDCASLGDMDLCQDTGNFVRVIRTGGMTEAELQAEFAPKPPKPEEG